MTRPTYLVHLAAAVWGWVLFNMELYQKSVIDELPELISSAVLATIHPAVDLFSGAAIRVHLIRATKVRNLPDSCPGGRMCLGSVVV